jgi:hypothetical protein
MPTKKLKRNKVDPGVGEMEEEEDKEEEEEDAACDELAQQQHPSPLGRFDEDGHAVPEIRSQIVSLRAHAESQAAAIGGME